MSYLNSCIPLVNFSMNINFSFHSVLLKCGEGQLDNFILAIFKRLLTLLVLANINTYLFLYNLITTRLTIPILHIRYTNKWHFHFRASIVVIHYDIWIAVGGGHASDTEVFPEIHPFQTFRLCKRKRGHWWIFLRQRRRVCRIRYYYYNNYTWR